MATNKTKKKTTRKTTTRASRATAARKAPVRRAAAKARPKGRPEAGLSLRSAGPSFTVNDVETSLAFYRDVLGFKVKDRWEDKGQLLGAELSAGPVTFMLGQDDWKKGRDRDKGQGVRIYCNTDQDVDRIAERIQANGGTLTDPPRDEWGMRAFSIEDPDGYKITIATKSEG